MSDFVKVPSEYEPLIPVSVLALDLPAPAVGGWHAYLAAKGIRVVGDDLGRDCVARGDAARLFGEKREDEVRQAALRRLAEQEAVEADERRRALIWKGLPADAMPSDASPASVMLEAARDSGPRRQSAVAAFLDGDSMVMHPIHESGDDW
jgi:hypothetical protein